jgi:hypothetical protein
MHRWSNRGAARRVALAHRGAAVSTPAGDGPALSVAELQAALALAHARSAQRHGLATVATRPFEGPRPAAEPNSVPPFEQLAAPGERRIVVVSAHAGAGASTVALALADAAAADGTMVRLIDCAAAAESGLADAASEVVGIDRTGQWYRGRRGTVTIHHAADATLLGGEARCGLTVIDSGPARPGGSGALGGAIGVVVVCAATVPGLRQAEAALGAITGPVVLAAVGPRKWPGVVTASLGPAAAGLRRDGRLVRVPLDRRLAATGLTGDPLPRRVVAAARAVLQLLPAPATTATPPWAQHADGKAATR